MEFPSKENRSRLPFPSPGDLFSPKTEPASPVSPTLQVHSLPAESLGKSIFNIYKLNIICV